MIPFSPPRIDQKIIEEVTAALQSGWFTTGPRTKLLEQKIAGYCNIPKTLCLNSATAGLELMLRWFGIGPGDEVIVPAYTYCATANVVIHCGATPVMADILPDFNICPKSAETLITAKTKAIIPVDIGGLPADYSEIWELVNKEPVLQKFQPANEIQKALGRMLILSDSAHSIGAVYQGRKTGSWADASVFSFHAVKNLTTGEGGAVCLNLPSPFDNELIYKQLCIKSLHGQSKDALAKTQKGGWEYDVLEPGYKWNMTDILASIGLVELDRYESETLPRRREIMERYNQAFKSYSWAELPVFHTSEKQSSCHLYLLRIKGITVEKRNDIIERIFNREVSVNVHYKPLPLLTAYKDRGYRMENYPNAYNSYCRVITLPVFYDLSPQQQNTVIKAVIQSVEEAL